ncbi:MAG: FtsW/RodA/SpoVE family cell cycle protein [Thermoflexales bacterium]|nr:FtsW/RodA/SpoVE family cell cycle protein [Thermoflexales bacterium]
MAASTLNGTPGEETRPGHLSLLVLGDANRVERVLLALAGAFTLAGLLQLAWVRSVRTQPGFTTTWFPLILPALIWTGSFVAAHGALCRYRPRRDPILLPLAALLAGWGLIEVARLAPAFLWRQALWLPLSLLAFLAVSIAPPDLRWLRRYKYTWLFGGLALLAATLVIGVNPSGYGERLWLGLGNVYFQPSELLKLLFVAYLAAYLAEKRELLELTGSRVWKWRLPASPYLAPVLAMWALAMGLLAWQRDLGAAILFFFTFLGMLYLAGGQWSYLLGGCALFLAGASAAYYLIDRVALRVDAWWNPWPDAAGRSYQIVQSLLAFASGGLIGQGVGQGAPTLIPVVHSDFVFAAIGEEFGLVGTLAVLACVAVLVARGFRAAIRASTAFEQLLAAGLALLLGLQAWIIMGGNVKLIPLTGVTLPFVSYGGSSLLSSFVILGLLLHVTAKEARGDLAWRGLVRGRAAGGVEVEEEAEESALLRQPSCDGNVTEVAIRRLALGIALAFGALALALGYWQVVRRPELVLRDDNPRLVLAKRAVWRGTIFDRRGVPIATSRFDEDKGEYVRSYPEPLAEPLVGYYSLRYGTGGAEAAFDARLRGVEGKSDLQIEWHNMQHKPWVGQDVTLTLDVEWQRAAYQALGDWRGVVMVAELDSGQLLAVASRPAFDPNSLDADWERLRDDPSAPLLNRAFQGQYQPGSLFQTVIMEEALRSGLIVLSDTATAAWLTAPVIINGDTLVGCVSSPQGETWADAYTAGCPGPFSKLSNALDVTTMERLVRRWGLDALVSPDSATPLSASAWHVSEFTKHALVLGQGKFTFTPAHVMHMLLVLSNDGRAVPIRMASDPYKAAEHANVDVRAEEVLALRRQWSQACGVSGLTGQAVSGAQRLVWYMGIAPALVPRYGVVILLEGQQDLPVSSASKIACQLLAQSPP